MGDNGNLHESPGFDKYHEKLDDFQDVLCREKEI